MALLFVIVADMVLKPTVDSFLTLLVMALVLIAAGSPFLGKLRGRPAPQTSAT